MRPRFESGGLHRWAPPRLGRDSCRPRGSPPGNGTRDRPPKGGGTPMSRLPKGSKASASKTSAPRQATRRITVIAQDPAVRDEGGNILMAQIDIPAEELAPGPMGHRVHVVDFD